MKAAGRHEHTAGRGVFVGVVTCIVCGSLPILVAGYGLFPGSSAAHLSAAVMLESGHPVHWCLSTESGVPNPACTTINLFPRQSATVPGLSTATTVRLHRLDDGLPPLRVMLVPGGCVAAPNPATGPFHGSDLSGFCNKIDLTIGTALGCVTPRTGQLCPPPTSRNTLQQLGSTPLSLGRLGSGRSRAVTFTLAIDPSASNADQGLMVSEDFTWELVF